MTCENTDTNNVFDACDQQLGLNEELSDEQRKPKPRNRFLKNPFRISLKLTEKYKEKLTSSKTTEISLKETHSRT